MKSIIDFYSPHLASLYEDVEFREQMLDCPFVERGNEESDEVFFHEVFSQYLGEAQLTLELLNSISYTKEKTLLEIGGGYGFVYGFLKAQGYDIWSIEPCDSGFDGYYNAAQHLLKIIGVDDSHFKPLLAKDVAELNTQFDVIFSNNVFEHIPRLEESLIALKNVLKPGGVMIHNTVNYFIPYEPHFRIPLIPFFPRSTELLKPSLKKSKMWNDLNFVTTRSLRKMCKANGLSVNFQKDRLLKTFLRFGYDNDFAKRQRYFMPLYKFLKMTGLIKLLGKVPVSFSTPITFTIRNNTA